jgi:hypothetical protein
MSWRPTAECRTRKRTPLGERGKRAQRAREATGAASSARAGGPSGHAPRPFTRRVGAGAARERTAEPARAAERATYRHPPVGAQLGSSASKSTRASQGRATEQRQEQRRCCAPDKLYVVGLGLGDETDITLTLWLGEKRISR